MSATAPRRVRLHLAYDGTGYAGWQLQAEARTVQGVLEQALTTIQGGAPVRVRGAGRTDAGVHARGQVADAEIGTRLDDAGLLRSLRSILPRDLRPLALSTADPSFNARRDARGKTYRYLVDRSAHGDPFLALFAMHVPGPMDLRAIGDGLARLPGRRDWSGFAGSACVVEDRVRNLTAAILHDDAPDLLAFTFSADGFLNRMVRNIVGTLLEVGRGRFGPERVDEVLRTGRRSLAGPTAPARGLCLVEVDYGEGPGEGHWCTMRRIP